MKQIVAVMLTFSFFLALCGCRSGPAIPDTTPTTEQTENTSKPAVSPVVLPDTGKKAPAGTLVTEDITAALAEKNPHAVLSSAEVKTIFP